MRTEQESDPSLLLAHPDLSARAVTSCLGRLFSSVDEETVRVGRQPLVHTGMQFREASFAPSEWLLEGRVFTQDLGLHRENKMVSSLIPRRCD